MDLDATTPAHTFVDSLGTTRAYATTTFKVAPGTTRLTTTNSWTGAVGTLVRVTLLDPSGTYSGYSLPQGTGNFGRIELHDPAPGTWTAVVWTANSAAGYSGPVHLTETSYRASSGGTVSPSSFTLGAGKSQTVTVRATAPSSAARATSFVVTGAFGATSVSSLVIRAEHTLSTRAATRIKGSFDTANGRAYSPGSSVTYLLDVPAKARTLTTTLRLADASNLVVAHLSDPYGEPVATTTNQHPVGSDEKLEAGLQIVHASPVRGVWRLTLELANPAVTVPEAYQLTAGLGAAPVTSKGVPTKYSTVVSRTKGSKQTITIRNTGPATQTFFVDARSLTARETPLVAVQAKSSSDPFTATAELPLQTETVPGFIPPTESSSLTVGGSATAPTTFDLMPLNSPTAINAPNDPDTESTTGTAPTVTHSASHVASALWGAFPTLIGPAPAAGQSGESISMQASAMTRGFWRDYTASSGDPMLNLVDPNAPTAKPVTIAAGHSATITLTLKPSAARGAHQRGVLYVDTLQTDGLQGITGYADVMAALPFAYTVGR